MARLAHLVVTLPITVVIALYCGFFVRARFGELVALIPTLPAPYVAAIPTDPTALALVRAVALPAGWGSSVLVPPATLAYLIPSDPAPPLTPTPTPVPVPIASRPSEPAPRPSQAERDRARDRESLPSPPEAKAAATARARKAQRAAEAEAALDRENRATHDFEAEYDAASAKGMTPESARALYHSIIARYPGTRAAGICEANLGYLGAP